MYFRKCIGTHIAISTLWMTMTSLLATFNISKAKDEFGNVVEPVVDFKSASIVAYVVTLFFFIFVSLFRSNF